MVIHMQPIIYTPNSYGINKYHLILAFMICNTLWFSFFYVMNAGQSTVCSLASRMRQPRSIRIMGAPLLLAALRQLP